MPVYQKGQGKTGCIRLLNNTVDYIDMNEMKYVYVAGKFSCE